MFWLWRVHVGGGLGSVFDQRGELAGGRVVFEDTATRGCDSDGICCDRVPLGGSSGSRRAILIGAVTTASQRRSLMCCLLVGGCLVCAIVAAPRV